MKEKRSNGYDESKSKIVRGLFFQKKYTGYENFIKYYEQHEQNKRILSKSFLHVCHDNGTN